MAARLRRREDLWRQFRKRTFLGTVLDPNGAPCSSPEASAGALRDHWSSVFKAPEVNRELWDEVSPFIQVLEGPLNIDWKLDYDVWYELLRKRSHSMPGIDGIPYGVWKNPPASRILLLCLPHPLH